MNIKAKHGAHEIQYDEEANAWHCKAMRCSAPSLSALRTKLNAEDREDRRINGIRAFSLDRGYAGEEAEVVIITMTDTSRHGVNGYRVGHSDKRREYFSLSSLVILSDKNAPAIERYKQANAAYITAQTEWEAARAALPRTTAEDLKKLSALSAGKHGEKSNG